MLRQQKKIFPLFSLIRTATSSKLTSRYSMKQTHPSATRNSQPIAEALCPQIDRKAPNLRLLEVASGSGQHVGYLAPLLPNVIFQPTEVDSSMFRSINAYCEDCQTKNILPPVYLDIAKNYNEWNDETKSRVLSVSFDYMFNSNMMHISPWACTVGLFRAAGQLLKPGGTMFTYGPYAVDGVLQPQSNVDFDASLRMRNAEWGVRDIANLKQLAKQNAITLQYIQEMPSNNKLLTWIKETA